MTYAASLLWRAHGAVTRLFNAFQCLYFSSSLLLPCLTTRTSSVSYFSGWAGWMGSEECGRCSDKRWSSPHNPSSLTIAGHLAIGPFSISHSASTHPPRDALLTPFRIQDPASPGNDQQPGRPAEQGRQRVRRRRKHLQHPRPGHSGLEDCQRTREAQVPRGGGSSESCREADCYSSRSRLRSSTSRRCSL